MHSNRPKQHNTTEHNKYSQERLNINHIIIPSIKVPFAVNKCDNTQGGLVTITECKRGRGR